MAGRTRQQREKGCDGLIVTIDAREYTATRPVTGEAYGATEMLLWRIARAVKQAGHHVNVVVHEPEEHFIEGIFWWTPAAFPRKCDVLISCEKIDLIDEFKFDRLIVPLNKIDPILAGNEARVDAFVVLSQNHADTLRILNPSIKESQCRVIAPGVEMPSGAKKVKNRIIWCNSPDRGLIHMARMWPLLLEKVPDASIVVTYNFARYLKNLWYVADNQATEALEILDWADKYADSVQIMGGLSNAEVRAEQAKAEVYAYPCDPPHAGSMVHCFSAMEAAAAGCAVVLSSVDGLPTVFGDVAEFVDDPTDHEAWAEHLAGLLKDEKRKAALSAKSREWAEIRPWDDHTDAWGALVSEPVAVPA